MDKNVLAVKDLSVKFGEVMALDGVTLAVRPDSIHGLIGPNGSGKTTFVNAVMGQNRIRSGTVEIGGVRVERLGGHRRRVLGASRTFQTPDLSDALTVVETLRVALYPLRIRGHRLHEEIDRSIELLNLTGVVNEFIGRLPYGVRKQVELARALLGDPKIVILDEAAAGLNSEAKRSLAEMLLNVQRERRFAALVIEHDMAFLQQLVSYVTVFDAGHIVAAGTFDEVVMDEGVREVYLGVGTYTSRANEKSNESDGLAMGGSTS